MKRSLFSALAWIALFTAAAITSSAHAQLAPNTLDTLFNTTGRTAYDIGTGVAIDEPTPLALQPDGKIVVGGPCTTGTFVTKFCLIRMLPSGLLDAGFGDAGRVISTTTQNESPNDIALQADEKILVAGTCQNASATKLQFCVRRYQSNGSLDPGFGVNGLVQLNIAALYDYQYVKRVYWRVDGRILLTGGCGTNTGEGDDFCAVRLLGDGRLDPSFGGGQGVASSSPPMIINYAASGWIQPDGKFGQLGRCQSASLGICVGRSKADGTEDTTFGTSRGYASLGIDTAVSTIGNVLDVRLRPDGKLLALANCQVGSASFRICLALFSANGTLELSFGSNGFVILAAAVGNQAHRMTLQSDGRVLVTVSGCPAAGDLNARCLARLHADGSPDLSFTSAVLGLHPFDTFSRIVVQRNGAVVVGGVCLTGVSGGAYGLCATRVIGGPLDYANCSADIDGDGRVTSTVDSLVLTRVALGFKGSAVTQGVAFAPNALRTTWPLLREYLVNQCGMRLVP